MPKNTSKTVSFHVLSNSFSTTIKEFDAIELNLSIQQLNTRLHKSWAPESKKNIFCNVVADTFNLIITFIFPFTHKNVRHFTCTKQKAKGNSKGHKSIKI